MVKLRNDQRLKYRGISSWPPRWIPERGGGEMVGNESGVLTHVSEAPQCDKCFLYVSHNDQTYVGCLLFEDVQDCRSVADLLKRNVGKPIQVIGDLEVAEKRLEF